MEEAPTIAETNQQAKQQVQTNYGSLRMPQFFIPNSGGGSPRETSTKTIAIKSVSTGTDM